MPSRIHRGIGHALAAVAVVIGLSGSRCHAQQPVAVVLEDNAESLLPLLTNPTGDPGQGFVEKAVVFSGHSAVKIVPMQRYSPVIPGWKFRITKNPGPGEYRYLRLAWKADGCNGIMVQFHDTTWSLRYTAGVDRYNWGTKFVAAAPPGEWAVVTCDLYKDFGERTITGMALTAFEGQAAYFDHIYFGRTVADLDRIDATGFRNNQPPELTAGQLEGLWADLAATDASKPYAALWRLVSVPGRSVSFLRGKLTARPPGPGAEQIRKWVDDLDDDRFRVREKASEQLTHHLEAAVGALEAAAENPPSTEVLIRAQKLLALRPNADTGRDRIARAVRVLEYVATPAARECLEELASGEPAGPAAASARVALERLKESGD